MFNPRLGPFIGVTVGDILIDGALYQRANIAFCSTQRQCQSRSGMTASVDNKRPPQRLRQSLPSGNNVRAHAGTPADARRPD
jgi:hypothetical protein